MGLTLGEMFNFEELARTASGRRVGEPVLRPGAEVTGAVGSPITPIAISRPAVTEFAAVSAGVRATIAAHAQAQDEGRTADMVALYLPDAVVEIPGFEPLVGADAIVRRSPVRGGGRIRPGAAPHGRNTLLTEWDDHTARRTLHHANRLPHYARKAGGGTVKVKTS